MPERPIFVPSPDGPELVREINFPIVWNPGFAPIQKKKNIKALHDAAALAGYTPLLEISTKSDEKVGQHLSAFHLKVHSHHLGEIQLECAFQGSKVFEKGGPYTDLYEVDARAAKRDPRLQESGSLVGFRFDGLFFPLEPKTAFYDWLYLNAIFPHREWLKRLDRYAGFTDIEFNPGKSINCQARSCALFVTLMKKGALEYAVSSSESFIKLLSQHSYRPHLRGESGPPSALRRVPAF
jgi:hypothetical protein